MIRVEDVVDRAGLEAAWRIRYEVFVVEQRVPVEEEVDALDTDPSTSHALAWLGDESSWPRAGCSAAITPGRCTSGASRCGGWRAGGAWVPH